MRYFALATDYDGTLATHGVVRDATTRALERFVASGRRLILVTGRLLEDLEQVFPRLDLFERVVAENGAIVYSPATKELTVLDEGPPPAFIDALKARGVQPLAPGRVIVGTWEPHQDAVIDTIRTMGLELHVEFNKGAVMILPAGLTKRTGLAVALEDMGLSPHNVVGVGDAENDHAFLSFCECAVSVSNALPALKERSDWVTSESHGEGVAELIERVLADDLRSLAPRLARHRFHIGRAQAPAPAQPVRVSVSGDGVRDRRGSSDHARDLSLDAYDSNLLVTGPSGSGKSTLVTAFVERLLGQGYQVCVIDPEGDHESRALLPVVGGAEHPPSVEEVTAMLDEPNRSIAADLLAVPMEDRARWFGAFLARVHNLRARSGRPHWLIVDEAHHLLPVARDPSIVPLPPRIAGLVLVTVHPQSMSRAVLDQVDAVVTTAQQAGASLRAFAEATGRTPPEGVVSTDAAVVWRVREGLPPVAVDIAPARQHHLRHKRKYARGELGEDKSFYFRGSRGALNLRAQNLAMFVLIAKGVDDDSWLFHLRAGDYSRWFHEAIKDDALAAEVAIVERLDDLPATESRARVRAAIERRYTLPA